MLCLLVIGVESRVRIGRRSIRVVSISIVVIILAKRLFKFFELLISIHVQISTQVVGWISLELVNRRTLTFRSDVFDSFLYDSTLKSRYLE